MRALIVDDDKQVRGFIELLLKEMVAVDTVEASNVKEALALLKCESADLIISDWSMPVMDGLELLKVCKGDAAPKHIPFIMSSGQGEEKADILRAIEAGVNAYIVKPFLPNELQDGLDKIMVKTDPRPRAWRRKLLQPRLRGQRFPGHEERRAFLHRGSVVI